MFDALVFSLAMSLAVERDVKQYLNLFAQTFCLIFLAVEYFCGYRSILVQCLYDFGAMILCPLKAISTVQITTEINYKQSRLN